MLVAFDLEGTLVDGEFFAELGSRLGLGNELCDITQDTIRGYLPFEEALLRRIELVRGTQVSIVKKIADGLPLMEGAKETIKTLHLMGFKTAILTGGFDVLANRVASQLEIDHVYSNHFIDSEVIILGFKLPILDPRSKAYYFKRLSAELQVQQGGCVAVGDGANDIPMLCSADLSIAFHATPRLREVAHVSVSDGDLTRILTCIARHLDNLAVSKQNLDLINELPKL